jgi:hypothetical protein
MTYGAIRVKFGLAGAPRELRGFEHEHQIGGEAGIGRAYPCHACYRPAVPESL